MVRTVVALLRCLPDDLTEMGIGSARAQLRPGDIVEVRPAADILETLDQDGRLEGVPFMPEMLRHVGRRFRVSRRVEKICDTITVSGHSPGSRRMHGTVFLDDLRCDGSGHDGCQAGCRIYWKEAWLTRVGEGHAPADSSDHVAAFAQLEQLARHKVRAHETPGDSGEEVVYSCQATEALNATTPLRLRHLDQYWREFSSGNVAFWHAVRVTIRAAITEIRSRLRFRDTAPLRIHAGVSPPQPSKAPQLNEPLRIQPGEWVRVRTPKQIAETLDAAFRNRGLWFDREMTPFCGGTYRVQDRVRRIIDERSGRMIEIGSDCLILEGVVCSGERSIGRWFCPRAIYPYWREAWLDRVESPRASNRG